jgi:hypothetical protein
MMRRMRIGLPSEDAENSMLWSSYLNVCWVICLHSLNRFIPVSIPNNPNIVRKSMHSHPNQNLIKNWTKVAHKVCVDQHKMKQTKTKHIKDCEYFHFQSLHSSIRRGKWKPTAQNRSWKQAKPPSLYNRR